LFNKTFGFMQLKEVGVPGAAGAEDCLRIWSPCRLL